MHFEQTLLVVATNLRVRLQQAAHLGPALTRGRGTPQPTQSAFFAAGRAHAARLLQRYVGLSHRDAAVTPERKLVAACSRAPLAMLNALPGVAGGRVVSGLARAVWTSDWTPLGGGRARPIPWDSDFALKHPTIEELKRYLGHAAVDKGMIPYTVLESISAP